MAAEAGSQVSYAEALVKTSYFMRFDMPERASRCTIRGNCRL